MKCRPASKRHVTPCPKCGAKWPVVQALWDTPANGRKRLVLCCTHCGIEGEVQKVNELPEAKQ